MFSSDKWFGASADFYSETIDQSLRFNDGDSPYLSRTFGTATSTTQGTWSCWFKRGDVNARGILWSASNYEFIDIQADGQIVVPYLSNLGYVYTNGRFRDPTNWYNLVVTFDTPNATEADRLRIYVNGVRQEVYDSITLSQNATFQRWNVSGYTGHIGNFQYNNTLYFDGYLAECNWIDGTALDASYFGETKNGVWIPKEISGLTYGNNGFRLTFADSSSLGDDTSGNGNDFTSSGLASTDVVLDSPTNNFCVFNALEVAHTNELTLSEGNLGAVPSATSAWNTRVGTFNFSSGKWYAEFSRVTDVTGAFFGVLQTGSTDGLYIGYGSQGYGYYLENGNVQNNASIPTNGSLGVTGTKFDVIGVALNLDDNELRFYKNGSVLGSNPISITDASYAFGASATQSGNLVIANWGQDSSFAGYITSGSDEATDENGQGDFFDAPPSGFLAMCSANIPDTTLSPNQSEQADDHFNTVIWSGDDTTPRTITGVGFQPDWIWTKPRSSNTGYSQNHWIADSSRGSGSNSLLTLYSNLTNAEFDATGTNGNLTAITSDGFTITGGSSTNKNRNNSGQTFVAWNWKVNGGTTSSNTAGDINSTVQVNTTAGFSIVTFTGNGVNGSTVGHGLGVKPAWYIVKDRDTNSAGHWMVYHHKVPNTGGSSRGNADNLFLNLSNGQNAQGFGTTDPATITTFKPAVTTYNNVNGNDYVAYVFAEVEGYSKFGTYSGNSSADGTFVYTGFRPAMVIFKATHTDDWVIADNKRDPHNQVNGQLFPSTNGTESTSNAICDFLSNGFKLRRNAGSINQNTYVYMAWAEQPFKFSNAR